MLSKFIEQKYKYILLIIMLIKTDKNKMTNKINPKLEQRILEMPEIQVEKGLWQNTFHEFDVFDHTIDYVNHMKNMTFDTEMIVAGYLHDIGKPKTSKLKYKDGKLQEKEPGKPYHDFDDHEAIGEQMVRKMDPGFFYENELNQERIAKLVGCHYLPLRGIKSMRKAKDYAEFETRYKELEETLDKSGLKREDVLTMFLADCLAKGKGCTDIDELFAIRNVLLGNKESSLKEIYKVQKQVYGGKE